MTTGITSTGLTNRVSVCAQALQTVLQNNIATLGVANETDIYYGDQPMFPRFPSICIESDQLDRPPHNLKPTGPQAENEFEILIILYIASIQDVQTTRLEADQLAETVADVVHQDFRLTGLVTFGYIRQVRYGYSVKAGKLVRSAKLTWYGINRTPVLI